MITGVVLVGQSNYDTKNKIRRHPNPWQVSLSSVNPIKQSEQCICRSEKLYQSLRHPVGDSVTRSHVHLKKNIHFIKCWDNASQQNYTISKDALINQ